MTDNLCALKIKVKTYHKYYVELMRTEYKKYAVIHDNHKNLRERT